MRCLLLYLCEKFIIISMEERILRVLTTFSVLSPSLKSQSITTGIQVRQVCLTLRNCNEKNHRTGECWHHAKGRAPPAACSSRVGVIHSAPFLPPSPLWRVPGKRSRHGRGRTLSPRPEHWQSKTTRPVTHPHYSVNEGMFGCCKRVTQGHKLHQGPWWCQQWGRWVTVEKSSSESVSLH